MRARAGWCRGASSNGAGDGAGGYPAIHQIRGLRSLRKDRFRRFSKRPHSGSFPVPDVNFARWRAGSQDGGRDRSVARSVGLSVRRSVGRTAGQQFARSVDRSVAVSVGRRRPRAHAVETNSAGLAERSLNIARLGFEEDAAHFRPGPRLPPPDGSRAERSAPGRSWSARRRARGARAGGPPIENYAFSWSLA